MSKDRKTASFEEVAYSNMLMLEALVEQLAEHGLIDRGKVIRRVDELKRNTAITEIPRFEQVTLLLDDMVAANSIAFELFVEFFVDKGLLGTQDLNDLHMQMIERTKQRLRKQ